MKDINFNKITPCGGNCDNCQHFITDECVGCRNNGGNCVKMWSNGCEIYKCSMEHDVLFCGLCHEFPCKWLADKIGEWNPNGIAELNKMAKEFKARYIE